MVRLVIQSQHQLTRFLLQAFPTSTGVATIAQLASKCPQID